jgi:ATP-dependent Clp protease ATP-binding subunit ClpC
MLRLAQPCRNVVRLAQQRATTRSRDYVGTEDLVVALLSERDGIAAQALAKLGLATDDAIIARGPRGAREERSAGASQFSRPAMMAVECALQEAYFLGKSRADTEHLLLGLLRTARTFPDTTFASVVGFEDQLRLRSEILRLVESAKSRHDA